MDEQERVIDGRVHIVIQPTKQRLAKRIDGERDVLLTEGDRGGLQMQSFRFPLDFYLRKQLVTRAQWSAGVRLNALWEKGCLAGYVQVQYRETDGGGPRMEFTPPGAFAIEYRAAMAAIRGVAERRIAYQVCCEGMALTLCKQFPSERTARRRGMPLLISALDSLADHFREQRKRDAHDVQSNP